MQALRFLALAALAALACACSPAKIAKLEADLAAPNLYTRDFDSFERLSKALDAARADLAASEEEWLALAERQEALEGQR